MQQMVASSSVRATSPPAGPALDAAVVCRGLVKRYADVVAVDGIDLEVRRGECFGLLGPNGAGKTTTVEILEGLLDRDAGEVRVLGLTWEHDERQLRERLGVQLQETYLAEKLTVEETLRLFRSFFREGKDVEEVLESVQLQEKRRAWVKKLSGGQKQRLSVACALVGAPDMLFLDEPTTGLDPQSRRALWDLVQGYRAGGGTIVLTTHYMEEAERLCDRVAILDHGRIVALDTPGNLIHSLGAEERVIFTTTGGLPESLQKALADSGRVDVQGERIVVQGQRARTASLVSEVVQLLEEQRVQYRDLHTEQATLEDVFLGLTGHEMRD